MLNFAQNGGNIVQFSSVCDFAFDVIQMVML